MPLIVRTLVQAQANNDLVRSGRNERRSRSVVNDGRRQDAAIIKVMTIAMTMNAGMNAGKVDNDRATHMGRTMEMMNEKSWYLWRQPRRARRWGQQY